MAIPQSELQAAADRIEAMMGGGIDRSTSYAKDAAPDIGQSFENAPELAEAYEAAQDADQPLEQPAEQETVSISAAAEIDPHGLDQTTLANAPDMGQGFDQAAASPVNDNTPERDEQMQDGSQMVRDDALAPVVAPDMEERRDVDREIFDQRWDQESERADTRQEELADAAARIEAMEAEQGQERDQGMGLG